MGASTNQPDRPEEENWRDLLAALDSGHDAAWTEVSRRLRLYSQRLVRRWPALDHHDADDIAQSVLLKLQNPKARSHLASKGSPLAYVIVMLRNTAADVDRLRRHHRPLEARPEPPPISSAPHEATMYEQIGELLAELTQEERELLRMRFWEGHSVGHIAELLGVKYSAAAVRLFRLLKRLRERLQH